MKKTFIYSSYSVYFIMEIKKKIMFSTVHI